MYQVLMDRAENVVKRIRQVDDEFQCSRILPSPIFQSMLVLAEDKRFWTHPGFDILAIMRSIIFTAMGRPHGASTIVQQLVRTITGRYEKTFRRKFEEIVVAYVVSRNLDRSIFLRVYISLAYYGTGMESFDAFIKRKKSLNISELNMAAMAIARLKYPEPFVFSVRRLNLIKRREEHLLAKFYALEYIKVPRNEV